MTQQMYAQSVSPWARNASELDRLRGQSAEADAAAEKEADPIKRMRAEQHAKALRRELQAAEFEARLDSQRRASAQQRAPMSAVRQSGTEPQFMEPVPYFADQPIRRAAQGVSNATTSRPKWPESFADRWALVQEAMSELRRIGAV